MLSKRKELILRENTKVSLDKTISKGYFFVREAPSNLVNGSITHWVLLYISQLQFEKEL